MVMNGDNGRIPLDELGCLVDVDFHRWGACVALKPMDFGISKGEWPETFSLGKRRLIDYKAATLKAIDKAARAIQSAVDKAGYVYPGTTARFVPFDRLKTLKVELPNLKIAFNQARQEFLWAYETLKKERRGVFREDAAKVWAWKHGLPLHTPPDEDDPNWWVFLEGYMKRVERQYPSEARLKEKFAVEWRYFKLAPVDAPEIAEDSLEGLAKQAHEFVCEGVRRLRKSVLDMLTKAQAALRTGRMTRGTTKMIHRAAEAFLNDEMFGKHDTAVCEALNMLDGMVGEPDDYKDGSQAIDLLDAAFSLAGKIAEDEAGELDAVRAFGRVVRLPGC